jgi:hypothetical protein
MSWWLALPPPCALAWIWEEPSLPDLLPLLLPLPLSNAPQCALTKSQNNADYYPVLLKENAMLEFGGEYLRAPKSEELFPESQVYTMNPFGNPNVPLVLGEVAFL